MTVDKIWGYHGGDNLNSEHRCMYRNYSDLGGIYEGKLHSEGLRVITVGKAWTEEQEIHIELW